MNVPSSDLIQAIRGPIMLMTLGGLVVLDYFQKISFTQRTWPVLLIVFGLLKLLERSQRHSVYPGPYDSTSDGSPPSWSTTSGRKFRSPNCCPSIGPSC
jgi:hypothetical protein